MNDPAIATAADYADAMYTARRAKNLLVLLIFVVLLLQLGLFFVARYTDYIIPNATATTRPAAFLVDWLQYLVGASAFLGIVLTIVLGLVLLLIVNIMLVGRLIGVAKTTSAYVWCLLLLVLLFPWQAFLANATFINPEFKIPGVLYTWSELTTLARFGIGKSAEMPELILRWARFVAWPVAAIIIVLAIQIKSNRGLRQAFGETEPDANL
jgi:hypothetical protein